MQFFKATQRYLSKLVSKLTGISTPIFGLSWEAPKSERETAKRILVVLDDHRVFGTLTHFRVAIAYDPHYFEEALNRLRSQLTEELKNLDQSSPLSNILSKMRAECRDLLYKLESARLFISSPDDLIDSENTWDAFDNFRRNFGVYINDICTRYDLEMSDYLKNLFPHYDKMIEAIEKHSNARDTQVK